MFSIFYVIKSILKPKNSLCLHLSLMMLHYYIGGEYFFKCNKRKESQLVIETWKKNLHLYKQFEGCQTAHECWYNGFFISTSRGWKVILCDYFFFHPIYSKFSKVKNDFKLSIIEFLRRDTVISTYLSSISFFKQG